jgi:signal transduction histidine kinase
VPLARSALACEALQRGVPAFTEDTMRDPRSAMFGREDVVSMAMLAIPIASRSRKSGVILVGDAPGRRFAPADLALATALGGELAMALENAELYSETRRRAEELSLLQDVGRTLVETLELEQVLDAGVKNLARMVDAPEAYLVLLDEATRELVVQAASGTSQARLGLRVPYDPVASATARCMERREPILLDDVPPERRAHQPLRSLSGLHSGMVLPLLVRDKAIGAAMIVESRRPRRFTAAEVQRATAVSNQLAVAVDNARAHARALAALSDLQHAQVKLLHQERLAALGELSAVVAHEVRNPLGVIFNSLGTLRRLVQPEGDARTLFDIVGEEADRLNRIVGDLLDFARPAPPQLRPERLDRLVDEAVAAALAQQPTTVRVVRQLDAALPLVPLDARQVRQALLNVAANAVQAMPRGGLLTVRGRLEDGAALVELEDTGDGIPEDVCRRIFEPFFTTKATGSGLGLAVVKRILDGHGGGIEVRSHAGQGTVFTLRFPLTPAPQVELAGRIG